MIRRDGIRGNVKNPQRFPPRHLYHLTPQLLSMFNCEKGMPSKALRCAGE